MKEINIEELRQLYTVEGKSRKEVADYFGVKPYVISNLVTIHNLQKPGQEDSFNSVLEKYPQDDFRTLYKNHPQEEMARTLGITGDV